MSALKNELPAGLRLAVVGSIALHAVVAVGLVFSFSHARSSAPKVQSVLTTRLVRLGKQRPDDWLPRKVAPPSDLPAAPAPPVSAPKVGTPAPAPMRSKPAPKVTPPAPPSARDRIAQLGQVRGALDRLRKRSAKSQDDGEGHPDGVREGEVTDLSRAIIGNKFATEVHRCLQANYAVEGVAASRLSGRSVTVVVKVATDGKFLEWTIEKGSGLRSMDRAVERALKLCGKVSAPDAAIRAQVRDDGIEIVFQP